MSNKGLLKLSLMDVRGQEAADPRTTVDLVRLDGALRARFSDLRLPSATRLELDAFPQGPTCDARCGQNATAIAEVQGLQTGIFFGLPQALRRGLSQAIANLDFNPAIKIGFDPTHVDTGISISEAKAGRRPG